MSRIGKQPITIPEGVEVKIEEQLVTVKGSKGELSFEAPREIKVEVKEKEIIVSIAKEGKNSSAFWGLTRALLQNNVEGVSVGFSKGLEIHGVGYKANVEGTKINVEAGYSHPVKLDIPEGLSVEVKKNLITISGIDKQIVGEFAANIRKVRKPEPYKGKGIRYVGEKVRRKEGKKGVGA